MTTVRDNFVLKFLIYIPYCDTCYVSILDGGAHGYIHLPTHLRSSHSLFQGDRSTNLIDSNTGASSPSEPQNIDIYKWVLEL